MSHPNPEHPIYKSDSSKQKTVYQKSVISRSSALARITQASNNMSLSKKIKSGYILIVGIAILGSTISLAIGDYYYYQAKQQKIKITQENRLLNKLRHTAFELQSIAGFSSSIQKTENLHKAKAVAIKGNTKLKAVLEKFNNSPTSFSIPEVKELLAKYRDTIEKLSQNLDTTLNQIEPLISNSDTLPQAQQILASFYTSDTNSNLLDLADDLAAIIDITEKQEKQAEVELFKAEIFRILIIFLGISLSIIIAYLFASYMSEVITYPLGKIKFALQKAAEESKLEMELSTTNEDDTGQITDYLNQLVNKIESLMIANKEAEQAFDVANQAKRRFMANISHELLTPLNGILGYTQVLHNSQNFTQKEQRGIKVIHKCAEHLLILINDIIDFSKIESNKIELNYSGFNLQSFLEEIIEIYQIKAREKDILLIYQPPSNLPSGIITDKKRLRQVLVNLLGNAIKFTECGSVKLKLTVSEITNSEVKINFAVQDTGIGISVRDLKNIFLPFEQVVDSKTHKNGTGLGLSISQKIVQLMESNIKVSSELGKGSIFRFDINCPITEECVERSVITTSRKIIGYSGPRKTILVVDDHWEHRSLIINILEPIGFNLIEAQNGEEGLEKANLDRPDLIISDIYMPILNGWEMLNFIRNSQNLRKIPFILTSANMFDKYREKIASSGASNYLMKPIQSEELYELLRNELQINWRYINSDNILFNNFNKTQQEAIVFPPTSELIMLLDYAKKGQIKGIIEELEKIANIDGEYQNFVNHLNVLLKDFNIKNIRSFLNENIQE